MNFSIYQQGVLEIRCGPVGWAVDYSDCRGVRLPTSNECTRYDTKLSDGKAPVLELSGMWSTPSLRLLPCLL